MSATRVLFCCLLTLATGQSWSASVDESTFADTTFPACTPLTLTSGNCAERHLEAPRKRRIDTVQPGESPADNAATTAMPKPDNNGTTDRLWAAAKTLNQRMQGFRDSDRLIPILLFVTGLTLTGLIAFLSIRVVMKRDRALRRAATVFDATGEGVIIMDLRSRIVAANNAFCESSGYDRNAIIGRHIRFLWSRRHSKAFYREMKDTLAAEGRWQGEVYTKSNTEEPAHDWLTINAVRNGQDEITQYVAVFSDIAVVRHSLDKLDHLARHDPVTELPNRQLLNDRLAHGIRRAARERRHLAVLFLDLDRFKNINDTLGHKAGDELLRQVSERLTAQIMGGDTVARLGGDEFTIMLEDYQSSQDASSLAQKVLDSFREAFLIEGQSLFVTTSIGISVFPGDGMTADELIKNADAAMYRAKERGKNNYQFYTSDLTIAVREKLRLESSLRLASEREEFELHYQPKWDTGTGDVTGVEALLRWRHPEYGLVGPEGFLSTLEDCGLILPLGEWILRTACLQAQAWIEQGLPPLQMSVNISGQQITNGDLLEVVGNCLVDSGLDPGLLELEITEGFVMRQPDEVIMLLKSIRKLGVNLAIDDFGTGYSSLSYLKQLPIQKLKIDRSFIGDIPYDQDDLAITSAIIALGQRLNMSIIAEGVETEEQLTYLREEGCEEAQGYLFSKPVPAAALPNLLQDSGSLPPCGTTAAQR